MDTKDLGEKVKSWVSKSAKASKRAFEKAGDKVQDFTDKSLIKVEIRQLEGKREGLYEELGRKVSQFLQSGEKLETLNGENLKEIENIQSEIQLVTTQMEEKEKEITSAAENLS